MIPVNIKEKTCQRVFKRAAAKIEVWSKGGFLRGDTMLGTASGKIDISDNSYEPMFIQISARLFVFNSIAYLYSISSKIGASGNSLYIARYVSFDGWKESCRG